MQSIHIKDLLPKEFGSDMIQEFKDHITINVNSILMLRLIKNHH